MKHINQRRVANVVRVLFICALLYEVAIRTTLFEDGSWQVQFGQVLEVGGCLPAWSCWE